MPDDDTLFKVGEVVAGAYEIRSVLGEGGMGRVYAAHDVPLNRKVAVKASWPRIDRAFLLKEAQALASIRHPAMISVYAAGTHRDIAYIVMEYLYGVNLETFLARRLGDSGQLGVDEALDILIPVADALAAIHRSGLAHRDVKPANVMLTPNGRTVLMDFGLVQVGSDLGSAVSGTPEYMSPEALVGRVDPRSAFLVDVYALGITAYELLTGDVPFSGATPAQTMAGHLGLPVPDVRAARPDVPVRLAGLLSEMLAKEPLERPPSMEAVLFRLRAARGTSRGAPGRATVAPPSLAPAALSIAPPPAPRDDKFKVLVVDDDAALAKLLGLYAMRAVPDAAVVVVGDAETALASVRERPPHVMLMDLHMPRINGIELCMMLRGMHLADDCAILAVSAGARDADIELLRQLGITRFIAKGSDLGARLNTEVRAVYEQWQRAAPPLPSRPPAPLSIPAPASAKLRAAKEVRVIPRVDVERMLRTVARALPSAALVLFDRDLRVLMAEGALFRPGAGPTGGGSRSGEVRTLVDVISPEHAAQLRPLCEAALEGTSGEVEVDVTGRRFRVRVEPLADEGGGISFGLAVAYERST